MPSWATSLQASLTAPSSLTMHLPHAACRQAACGKCMVKLDGAVKLACKEVAHDGMLLEPYSGRVVRDLLCQS